MNLTPSNTRRAGFTMVELLLALALGVLVAGILGALIHGLLTAGEIQTRGLQGPFAARSAVRTLSRELACAFAPPVKDLVPLELTTSTELGQASVLLAFYTPVPGPLEADIEHVTYAVRSADKGQSKLQRISVPCAGPFTNAPVTNLLFAGHFTLSVEVIDKEEAHAEWPSTDADNTSLPTSVRLTLALPGEEAIQTEVLIQSSLGISSPLERESADPEEE